MSLPWKTSFKEVNRVSGCLYEGPVFEGVYGLTKIDELDRLFNFQVAEKMKRDFDSIKNLLGSKITSEIIANKIVKLNPSD